MFRFVRYVRRMEYDYTIDRHRQPLLTIVEGLLTLIGLTAGGSIDRVSTKIYRQVIRILRPAESALRRLIVIMAHGLKVEPPTARSARKKSAKSGKRKSKGKRRRLFSLFDPRLRLDAGLSRRKPLVQPRIIFFDDSPVPPHLQFRPDSFKPAPEPEPEGVSATSLCRRLATIKHALENLSSEALRYARWRAKAVVQNSPKLDKVLRRGPPPGLRRNSTHEVHEILKDLHWLARNPPKPEPDTS